MGFTVQLFELRLDSIGNLYNAKDLPIGSERGSRKSSAESNSVVVDRIVSRVFFVFENTFEVECLSGPFRVKRGSVGCYILVGGRGIEKDALLDRPRKRIPYFFNFDDCEEFSIYHDSIRKDSQISDETRKLQVLTDWESVSAMPLWKVCQFASFICSKERKEEPPSKDYDSEEDYDSEGDLTSLNGYERHLDDHKNTSLREEFLAEAAKLADRGRTESPN